jgi:hypothetical protein
MKTTKMAGMMVAVLACLVGPTVAQADILFDYGVSGGVINVGSSQSVTLGANTGAVTLVPNGPAVSAELNGVTWSWPANPSSGGAGDIPTTLTLTSPITGTGNITENALVTTVQVNFPPYVSLNQSALFLYGSTAANFQWTTGGTAYDLTVLPGTLSTPLENTLTAGSYTGTLDGTFKLTATAVPEPTTLMAGGLLLLPFAASTLRILRRNRTAK